MEFSALLLYGVTCAKESPAYVLGLEVLAWPSKGSGPGRPGVNLAEINCGLIMLRRMLDEQIAPVAEANDSDQYAQPIRASVQLSLCTRISKYRASRMGSF